MSMRTAKAPHENLQAEHPQRGTEPHRSRLSYTHSLIAMISKALEKVDGGRKIDAWEEEEKR